MFTYKIKKVDTKQMLDHFTLQNIEKGYACIYCPQSKYKWGVCSKHSTSKIAYIIKDNKNGKRTRTKWWVCSR